MNKKALIILGVMVLLTPLGLLSEYPAWGEWDLSYFEKKLGFIPKGMVNSNLVKPIIPDYEVPGVGSISGYYISAIIGIGLIFLIYFILSKFLGKKSG